MNFLSIQGTGAAWTFGLLLFCLAIVHLVKLAKIGLRSRKAPPPKEEKKPEEPVYYIVERKKKRTKPEYSEPRRISFK